MTKLATSDFGTDACHGGMSQNPWYSRLDPTFTIKSTLAMTNTISNCSLDAPFEGPFEVARGDAAGQGATDKGRCIDIDAW